MNRIDPATYQAVCQFKEKILLRYRDAVIILFGSRARQTHHPESDADVAVLLPGPKSDYLTTKLAMSDIAFDLLLKTGIRISPLPIWLEEWDHPEHYSNPALLHNIAREGIRI